jgi:hypothetical protein
MAEVYGSPFLKGADIGDTPQTLTIVGVRYELMPDFKNPNKTQERAIVSFDETIKECILNNTSGRNLMSAWGEDEQQYIGRKVQLYNQPMTVKGEQRDVLMVRALQSTAPARRLPPRPAAPPAQRPTSTTRVLPEKPAAEPAEDFDDEIPM